MTDSLLINEIFFSIQGESTRTGQPCAFVRLTGCHLRCTYCDTEYAFHQGRKMAVPQILAEIDRLAGPSCNLVEVTGGEPLLQPAVHSLMKSLADLGKTVLLETSGASDISACDPRVIRIMDLKTPSSGQSARNHLPNLDHLRPHDELKFVLSDRADYDWARHLILTHRLHEKVAAILLSPAHAIPPGAELPGSTGLPILDLAQWLLADQDLRNLPTLRIQTQLHKLIWDPATRGV